MTSCSFSHSSLYCVSKGFPVAMAVTELCTGSAISQGGSLLYIFITANAPLWVFSHPLLKVLDDCELYQLWLYKAVDRKVLVN